MPLHIALDNKASAEVNDALLGAIPQALLEKDGRGKLPVQLASDKSVSMEVLVVLRYKAGGFLDARWSSTGEKLHRIIRKGGHLCIHVVLT